MRGTITYVDFCYYFFPCICLHPHVAEKATLPPDEKIISAFVHHFAPADPGGVVTGTDQLIEILKRLPSLSTEEHVETVAAQLRRHESGAAFSSEDQAVIAYVDEAVTEVLTQTDLDFKIESFIRGVAPHLAAVALTDGLHAVTSPNRFFDLIDLLIEECIGWSEDLGILGQQFMDKVQATVSGFSSGRLDAGECIDELQAVFRQEAPLFKKLEDRLCDRELHVLAGKKAQFFSTLLLNREMSGQQLPLFIIFMLQGPWFEFLRRVYIEYGEASKEWRNVQKMTEAMVWSLQPGRDSGKRTSIIQSLPASIRSMCDKAPFDTKQVVASLADLEGEYESIQAGEASDPCDFELLETDETMALALQEASRDAVKTIRAMPTDQWFLHDDPKEPDEKVARIKLILNWEDTEQLLLTNHNRRKVVHMSYSEMINHLDSGVLKKLSPLRSASETFRVHLMTVLKKVSDQNKKEKQIQEQEQRKSVSREYNSQRKKDLVAQLKLLEQLAERKKKRAMVLRHKARKKQKAAEGMVSSLKQDAWVKLPIMEGTLTPCKLVAIISAADKYIFANRAGLRVAEYTGSQLAHMIVTENSEILDTGAEFEIALATVVSGLREDRHKSYDELTGDTG